MFAFDTALPDNLDAALAVLGALAAGLTALGVIAKFPASRWAVQRVFGPAWRAVVTDPAQSWLSAEIGAVMEPLRSDVAELKVSMSEAVDRSATLEKSVEQLGDRLGGLEIAVEELKREVTPNGGNTNRMGDRVKRLEERAARVGRPSSCTSQTGRGRGSDEHPNEEHGLNRVVGVMVCALAGRPLADCPCLLWHGLTPASSLLGSHGTSSSSRCETSSAAPDPPG